MVLDVDDVAVGEALRAIQLAGLEHPHSDVDDLVVDAVDRDQAKAVVCGDGRKGGAKMRRVAGAVVLDQERVDVGGVVAAR